jgi:hypothetical protein
LQDSENERKAIMKILFKSRKAFVIAMAAVAALALGCRAEWDGSYRYYATTWEAWETDTDCNPITHVGTYTYSGNAFIGKLLGYWGHFTVDQRPGYEIPFVGTAGFWDPDGCGSYPFRAEVSYEEDGNRIEGEINVCGGVHSDSWYIKNFDLDDTKPSEIIVYENDVCTGMAIITYLRADRFTQ